MLHPLTHFRLLSRRQKCYVTIATLVTIVTTDGVLRVQKRSFVLYERSVEITQTGFLENIVWKKSLAPNRWNFKKIQKDISAQGSAEPLKPLAKCQMFMFVKKEKEPWINPISIIDQFFITKKIFNYHSFFFVSNPSANQISSANPLRFRK